MKNKIKALYIFLFLIVFISSCKDKKVVIPDNIFPEEKMIQVMSDVQLVETLYTREKLEGRENINKITELYALVLEKHEISREQFKESYSFYVAHPKLMEKVYEGVLAEISKKQAELAR
jgi:hypothetical protein